MFNDEENMTQTSRKNAVLLTEEKGRIVSEVAENNGIYKDLLCGWRREYRLRDDLALPGRGRESFSK